MGQPIVVLKSAEPIKESDLETEDDGCALCVYGLAEFPIDDESGVRVDLISRQEDGEEHPSFMKELVGKRVRVTIEVLEEE